MKWRSWIAILGFGILWATTSWAAGSSTTDLKQLPVQDAGRIKPFDTFAREALQLISGKTRYNGKPAYEVVMTWMLVPDHWAKEKIFQVRHAGLREALKLESKDEVYHSAEELMLNERLALLFQELRSRLDAKEKLDPYFQAIQTLNSQLTLFHGIRTGQAVRVVPPPAETDGEEAESLGRPNNLWKSVADLEGVEKAAFERVAKAFVAGLTKGQPGREDGDAETLEAALPSFIDAALAANPQSYADQSKIVLEVHYQDFHPFKWAWMLYLVTAVLLLAYTVNRRALYYKWCWLPLAIAFLLHAYGMALRVYLTGRPPVSNMYETVIWVPWVAVIFAALMEWRSKSQVVLLAASVVAAFCLILSDLSPVVLDGSLQPLEAVLRDNFWLMTHVLIIVSSYGAFFLAFVIGDIVLLRFLQGEAQHRQEIKDGVHAIYRSIQIGVVLLAAGTILGGIWADYSWGRFWGWDPKETWALIALLGYLAILHGRLVGWIRDFEMAAGAVIAFSLVIMAWYGVNFVLGAGLHTYGFGAGGVEYVSAFVAAHVLYVVYVATVRQSRLRTSK